MPKKLLLLPFILLIYLCSFAQDSTFTFGNVTWDDLRMQRYEPDTSANAVVLREFGKTFIDNESDNSLIHWYHVKIKIFNEKGFDHATFYIPIHKSPRNGHQEMVNDIRASTFNWANGRIEETKLDSRRVYTENKSRYYDQVKFTLPNVKPGSVLEVMYTVSSPYIYNFRNWEFQSDIPKIYSEYWARIPANLIYSITLRGFYKLCKNQGVPIRDCLTTFHGGKADCSLLKFAMKDIPAFKEEKYMTASSNFLSAIEFELSEVHYFNGSVEKVTKEWSDVEHQLKTDDDFGRQLKKGENLFSGALDTLIKAHPDPLEKAQAVYAFIRRWYKWDGYTGMFCEHGLKKAFERRSGNTGDINLSLVAALRYAGFKADPVLLSTRDNGFPNDLHPVISDFNWVLAHVKIKDRQYLLDATDPYLPFGVIPARCLSGRGRLMPDDDASAWIPLTPAVKLKQNALLTLKITENGKITGHISRRFNGYGALDKRKEISGFNSEDEYIEKLDNAWPDARILDYKISHLRDLNQPLVEDLEVEMTRSSGDPSQQKMLLNPFFMAPLRENPFKSAERNFPVDFGTAEDVETVLVLEYPPDYRIESEPQPVSLALPDNGGKYLMGIDHLPNKLILRSMLIQQKSIYSPREYFSLKELYNRIIQTQRADVILVKKLTAPANIL